MSEGSSPRPSMASPVFQGESVHVWWIEPAGLLTWFPPGSQFSGTDSRLLKEKFPVSRMKKRFPGVAGYYFIHDWANVVGYDSETKRHQLAWAKSYTRTQFGTCRVVAPPDAPVLLRMVVATGATLLVVAGYDVKIVPELQFVRDELGIRVVSGEA